MTRTLLRLSASATLLSAMAAMVASGCADPVCNLTLTAIGSPNGHAPFGLQLEFNATTCDGSTPADFATAGIFSLTGPNGGIEEARVAVVSYEANGETLFSLGFCAPDGASEGTYTLNATYGGGAGSVAFNLAGVFDGSLCDAKSVVMCGAQCDQPDCGATVGCCERVGCGSSACGDDGCGIPCGSCDPGESCSPQGKCSTPWAVTSGEQDPRGIATDTYFVYWTLDSGGEPYTPAGACETPDPAGTTCPGGLCDAGGGCIRYGVKRSDKQGGDIVGLSFGPAWAVKVDAKAVFWTAHTVGKVLKAAKDGSDTDPATGFPTPIELATGQTDPRGLALDDDHVYWTDVTGDAVRRIAKDGSGTVEDLATNQEAPRNVAVNGDYVYWTNSASGTVLEDGTVNRVLKTGGAIQKLATNLVEPWGLYVDDTYVYWTSYVESGEILRVPNNGGTPEVLAKGFVRPRDITGDVNSIYWLTVGVRNGLEFNAGAVYALKKNLTAGQTVADKQKWVGLIALDSSGIYWTQGGTLDKIFFLDGRVMAAWK